MSYKTINLVDYTKSDIPYHINNYPDGHKHIVLEGCEWNKEPLIDIIVRIDSMDAFFILMQVKSILSHEKISIKNLYIIYLLTARCDRRFSMGEAIDLELIGNLLYSLHPKRYFFYDAHNIPNIVKSNSKVENITTFKYFLNHQDYNICFPDQGACDRYSDYIRSVSLIGDKHRKPDGINMDLKVKTSIDSSKPILVIDDLCDGGGTFNVLANSIDYQYPDVSKEIFVTHAIQKSGIELLAAKYDQVYITNSYKDWNKEKLPDNVVVYNILRLCSDIALIFQNSER